MTRVKKIERLQIKVVVIATLLFIGLHFVLAPKIYVISVSILGAMSGFLAAICAAIFQYCLGKIMGKSSRNVTSAERADFFNALDSEKMNGRESTYFYSFQINRVLWAIIVPALTIPILMTPGFRRAYWGW